MLTLIINSKYRLEKLIFLFFVLLFFLLGPIGVFAAIIYPKVNSSEISIGDSVIIDLIIDSEGQAINVVEGDVKIDSENIKIRDFSLADSALSYWLKTPFWSPPERQISFVGGVPGGFNSKSAFLFKIIISAESPGQVVFLPANIKAYANDGSATPIQVKIGSLAIKVNSEKKVQPRDEWNEVISKDNNKPQNLVVDIGQDYSLFDGKKFLTFSAVDNESGIDYYEVKEGDRPIVRSGAVYVLQNQEKMEPIVVVVYDKAGNSGEITIKPEEDLIPRSYIKLIGLIIILAALISVFYKKFPDKIKRIFKKIIEWLRKIF